MPIKKIYVIAGNPREFAQWCHEKLVSPHSPLVCYVEGVQSLKGLRDPTLVTYGTYYNRKDYGDLENLVRYICRPPKPSIVYVEMPPKPPILTPISGKRFVAWK
jgi:hypothetical protein